MYAPPRPLRELTVITRAEALAAGLDDQAIARKVRRGEWQRIRHGSYMPREIWHELDERDRHRALAIAISRRAGCLHAWSHVTALAQLNVPLWDQPLGAVHLTRFDQRAGRRAEWCSIAVRRTSTTSPFARGSC